MTVAPNNKKPYDLEERTYAFALEIRLFLRHTKWDPVSWPDIKQLLRSSGSVAANYIEYAEGISESDSLYRLRIAKKEACESGLWLRLISDSNPIDEKIHASLHDLINETSELVKIFASIIRKKSAQPPLP
ncbi:MAG: four helix bundle protein [Akkermansiaceae bacterium]|nr:four helix bundle protein [Akkermansiaceae bacterium]